MQNLNTGFVVCNRWLYGNLAPIERLDVEKKYKKGIRPNTKYDWRCYEFADKYMLKIDDAERKLVYGFVLGGINHAWVEIPGGIVFDGANQKFYDKADYYKKLNVIVDKVYNPVEAGKLISNKKAWYEYTGELR